MSELDPHWEWVELHRFGDPEPMYIKGRCNHLETIPVHAQNALDRLLDETAAEVARLCLTCDAQLPAGWTR